MPVLNKYTFKTDKGEVIISALTPERAAWLFQYRQNELKLL